MDTSGLTDFQILKELENRLKISHDALADHMRIAEKLKDVNHKLLESEKLKSNFLSNIKNEIKNPLTAILGLANLMLSGEVSEQKFLDYVKLIYDETFELNFQLKNICLAADLEGGVVDVQVSHVNIKHLLERLIVSYESVFHHSKPQFKLVYNGPELFYTDSGKMHILISNLFSNAIKFSDKGSIIQVTAEVGSNNKIYISVKDEGIGIREEDFERIFGRFVQLDSGKSKEYPGHGLGLAIVKSLTELLDGEVNLESIEGEGTTFIIALSEYQQNEKALQDIDFDDNLLFGEDEILF